jgi:hypothetical protein
MKEEDVDRKAPKMLMDHYEGIDWDAPLTPQNKLHRFAKFILTLIFKFDDYTQKGSI